MSKAAAGGGEETWFDELVVGLAKAMSLKRRAKLWWKHSDDSHVTILNRLLDLQDIHGARAVTVETASRHSDLLKDIRGLMERSRPVNTRGDRQAHGQIDSLRMEPTEAMCPRHGHGPWPFGSSYGQWRPLCSQQSSCLTLRAC